MICTFTMPSASQGQVHNLILKLIRQAGAPNEYQVIYSRMNIHPPRELHNPWDVPALGQVDVKVYRHRGSIIGD
jgi:hypothetical protein